MDTKALDELIKIGQVADYSAVWMYKDAPQIMIDVLADKASSELAALQSRLSALEQVASAAKEWRHDWKHEPVEPYPDWLEKTAVNLCRAVDTLEARELYSDFPPAG
jgi:hypothetical protein